MPLGERKLIKEFNINHTVWVKLTEMGKRILESNGDTTWQFNKVVDGWTEVQLWVLMDTFGDHLGNGRAVPFETGIRFNEKDLKKVKP